MARDLVSMSKYHVTGMSQYDYDRYYSRLSQWEYDAMKDQYYNRSSNTTHTAEFYYLSEAEKNRYYAEMDLQLELRSQRKEAEYRERLRRQEVRYLESAPFSYTVKDEMERLKALMPPASKKEETPLDWLHKRVNEVCDEALKAVV